MKKHTFFPSKKKKGGKREKRQDVPSGTIMGVSRTVVQPLNRILGESKTKISDSSGFIQGEVENRDMIVPSPDHEEIDLSGEEIPLECDPAATGVSIEEIERMNKSAFSLKLGKLLDECTDEESEENKENENDSADTSPDEIDKWFNK